MLSRDQNLRREKESSSMCWRERMIRAFKDTVHPVFTRCPALSVGNERRGHLSAESGLWRENPQAMGDVDGGGRVVDLELLVDALDVGIDGRVGDAEAIGDFLFDQSLAE